MALCQNLFRLDRIRFNVCLKCCSFYQNRSNFSSLPTSASASFRLTAKNRSHLKVNKPTSANVFNSPAYFSIQRRFQSTKIASQKATASREPEQNVRLILTFSVKFFFTLNFSLAPRSKSSTIKLLVTFPNHRRFYPMQISKLSTQL